MIPARTPGLEGLPNTSRGGSATDRGQRPPIATSTLNVGVVALLLATTLLLALHATNTASIGWGVAAVMTAATTSVIGLLSSAKARDAGLILPMSIVTIWTLGFGISTLAWRYPDDLRDVTSRGLMIESIPRGLAIASVGLLAWLGGYLMMNLRLIGVAASSLRRWATPRGSSNRPGYQVNRILAVYVVGLVARLGSLAIGQFAYITSDLQAAITTSSALGSILGRVQSLTVVATVVLAYVTFRQPTRQTRLSILVVLTIEVLFGLLSGMRSEVIFLFVSIGLTYWIVTNRVPWRAVVATLIAVSILTPFSQTYRDEVRDGSQTAVTSAEAAALVPEILASTLRALSIRDVATAPSDFVTQRMRFVDDAALVSQRSPSEIPFIAPSDTLGESISVFVPRALWRDKPVYTVGLDYAQTYWEQPESVVSARSPSFPGDAFIRGGWAALVILMALVGALMSTLNRSLSTRLHTAAAPLFVLVWLEFVNLQGSLVLLTAGLAQVLLIGAAALRWCSVRQRRHSRRTRGSRPQIADRHAS